MCFSEAGLADFQAAEMVFATMLPAGKVKTWLHDVGVYIGVSTEVTCMYLVFNPNSSIRGRPSLTFEDLLIVRKACLKRTLSMYCPRVRSRKQRRTIQTTAINSIHTHTRASTIYILHISSRDFDSSYPTHVFAFDIT